MFDVSAGLLICLHLNYFTTLSSNFMADFNLDVRWKQFARFVHSTNCLPTIFYGQRLLKLTIFKFNETGQQHCPFFETLLVRKLRA